MHIGYIMDGTNVHIGLLLLYHDLLVFCILSISNFLRSILLLFPFSSSSDGLVTLAGSGSGGFDELVQNFDQKQVMFGVLKVLGKDVRKSVESIRPKFIFFTFIGEEVPVLQRARVSVQRPDVEKIFNVRTTATYRASMCSDGCRAEWPGSVKPFGSTRFCF